MGYLYDVQVTDDMGVSGWSVVACGCPLYMAIRIARSMSCRVRVVRVK